MAREPIVGKTEGAISATTKWIRNKAMEFTLGYLLKILLILSIYSVFILYRLIKDSTWVIGKMESKMDKEFMSIKMALNEKGFGKTAKDLNGLMMTIYDILFYFVKTI